LYAKVIAILIWNNLFSTKKNIIQIFPKSWLREVHASQRILKYEVFIIFVYFLDVFLRREGRHERKMGGDPLVRVGGSNRD
jgi:hypothetical protein